MVGQNRQSIETGNADHTKRRIKTKQKHKKKTTTCLEHNYPQASTNNVNET